jgi:hypothetical protein
LKSTIAANLPLCIQLQVMRTERRALPAGEISAATIAIHSAHTASSLPAGSVK